MSQFDDIVDDTAARFGLGPKAGALVHELEQLVAASPDGITGFINKFRTVGLSREVSGWIGGINGATLTPIQVEQALGSDTIDTIARKVGLPSGTAAAAIGYLAPKLVGRLTSDDTTDSNVASSVSDVTRTSDSSAPRYLRSVTPYAAAPKASASSARWIVPLLALLAAGGAGWYLLANRAPVATQSASIFPSRLAITNDNGVITVSGTVRDQASRNAILGSLRRTFGKDKVKGDIAIDPNAAPPPWLANLPTALDQMKTPGLEAVFEGGTIKLGGSIGDTDHERIVSALTSVFAFSGAPVKVATNAAANAPAMSVSGAADQMSAAISKTAAALSALRPGFQPTELLDILNKSIIHFPTGSADIPAANQGLLQQAAMLFKQLPVGTVVEISGHTDNTGDQNANRQLSQSRAEAVKNALTQSGVNPAMLVAKGYGDANPVASNDTAQGRLQNRRIAYHLQPSTTVGSGRK